MHSVEIACRMRLRNGYIWDDIDLANFDGYHDLRLHIYETIRDKISNGITYSFVYNHYWGKYGDNANAADAEVWAKNQTQNVIARLYKIVHKDASDMWRGEERTVHKGNGTVTVTDKQLAVRFTRKLVENSANVGSFSS